jgi:Amt family ammonium transporter
MLIGSPEYFGLRGVLQQPSIGSTRIPSIVFCVYQLMFAAITYVFGLFSKSLLYLNLL